jgi:hypothetical protein
VTVAASRAQARWVAGRSWALVAVTMAPSRDVISARYLPPGPWFHAVMRRASLSAGWRLGVLSAGVAAGFGWLLLWARRADGGGRRRFCSSVRC